MTAPICKELVKFLKDAALLLTDSRVVSHPSFVGLARYNPSTKVNRYVALFGDWAERQCLHYVYPKEEWREPAHDLKDDLKRIDKKYPNLVDPIFLNTEEYEKNKTVILDRVFNELKQIVFHGPIAERILSNALQTDKSFGSEKLQRGLEDDYADRRSVEKESAHLGHWAYGVVLERFYLCWYRENIYTLYFFTTTAEETENIYQVAAFCKNNENAKKISTIDGLVKDHNFCSISGGGTSKAFKDQIEFNHLRTHCKRCMVLPAHDQTNYPEAKKIVDSLIDRLSYDELNKMCAELTDRAGETWQFSAYRRYFLRFL